MVLHGKRMKWIHVTSCYQYAFTVHTVMVLTGTLWYIQGVCLKNNTQILNKPLGSISNLKDPQSWACEWHFFPLFNFSLTTEVLFFLPLIVVAEKITHFVKEINFCAVSTWVPESGPKLDGNSCCIIYDSANKHIWNLQSFHKPS